MRYIGLKTAEWSFREPQLESKKGLAEVLSALLLAFQRRIDPEQR